VNLEIVVYSILRLFQNFVAYLAIFVCI